VIPTTEFALGAVGVLAIALSLVLDLAWRIVVCIADTFHFPL
jgi:hypothetical protein